MPNVVLRAPEFATGQTLGALNDTLVLNLRGNCPVSVAFQLTGSGSMTIAFELSIDNGANYFATDVVNANNTNTRVLTASAAGLYMANYSGGLPGTQVRMRVSAYTSGTFTGLILASQWA